MWKAIGKMAVPSVITTLVMVVYNMADMFFVGLTNDTSQVAAVSISAPVFTVLMALGSMLGSGGSLMIARNLGENDTNSVKLYSSLCCWASVALGLVYMLVCLFGRDLILLLLGANEDIWQHSQTYITVLAFGAPLMIFTTAFSNIIRAEGAAHESMMGHLLSTLTNIVLDPLFIIGFNMGIGGAAVATVIANAVGAVYLIVYIIRKKSQISLHPRYALQRPLAVGKVLALGAPNAINSFMTAISSVFANRLLIGYGTIAVAAMGAASKSVRVISFVQMGLCFGVQPMLAYCYGAKNLKRLKEIVKKITILTVIVGSVLAAVCLFNSRFVITVFLRDPAALEMGREMVSLLVLSGPFIGVFYVATGFLQASGNALLSSVTSLLRQGIFFIPLIYVMNAILHVRGNIGAHLVADALATAVAVVLAIRQFKVLQGSSIADPS